jgi:hypothetical protein
MLDFVLLAKIVLAGALVAAAVMGIATRALPRRWRGAGWSWSIGAGVIAACGTAGVWPQWPALEDRARFVTLIVPLAAIVETAATGLHSRGLVWLLRACLALVLTPILLYDTVYLVDWNGPGSAEWTTAQAVGVSVGWAAMILAAWFALDRLHTRTSTLAVASVLLMDAAAAAIAVMLSGYLGAGLLGLGLAAALAGAALAYLLGRPSVPHDDSLSVGAGGPGVAVVGIVAVVVMGRYFGSLSLPLAAGLLVAPLLAWLAELSVLGRLTRPWQALGRFACVAALLTAVVLAAGREFVEKSNAPTGSAMSGAERDGR